MAKAHDLIIGALEQYDILTSEERFAIESLPVQLREFRREEDIVRVGDRPTQSCLILEGFAARTQLLEDGSRQITALHVCGDFVDLHSLLLKVMDHGIISFGPTQAAFIPHGSLRRLVDSHRHLARLFWMTTLVDSAIERAWVTCLGRRSAADHLVHLICELYLRLKARGLTKGMSFQFPATQGELGDILGLSMVHVNRTLQDLRRLGLVTWEGRTITVDNFEQLRDRISFDATFLYQWQEPR